MIKKITVRAQRPFQLKQWTYGTAGFRAVVGQGFTAEKVKFLAQAIINAAKYQTDKRFFIGYDTRITSKGIANEIAQVAVANGLEVIMSDNFSSTPEFYQYVSSACQSDPTPIIRGLLVMASHNPGEFNGLYPVTSDGLVIKPDLCEQIAREVAADTYYHSPDSPCTDEVQKVNMQAPYLETVSASSFYKGINGRGHTVVIDPMHGTGGRIQAKLLSDCGFSIELINNSESIVNSTPCPQAGNLDDLEAKVGGKFIDWNMLFPLFIDYLIEKGLWLGDMARTHTTTQAIDIIARQHGLKLHKTPVGFSHISRLLYQTDCFGGFEGDGGAVMKFIGTDKDGFLMNLLMAKIVAERLKGQKITFGVALDGDSNRFGIVDSGDGHIAGLVEETLQKYGISQDFGFMQEISIPLFAHAGIKDKVVRFNANPEIFFARSEIKKIEEFGNGHKTKIVTLTNGSWVVIRTSGTEPAVKAYVEAPTIQERESLKTRVEAFLRGEE